MSFLLSKTDSDAVHRHRERTYHWQCKPCPKITRSGTMPLSFLCHLANKDKIWIAGVYTCTTSCDNDKIRHPRSRCLGKDKLPLLYCGGVFALKSYSPVQYRCSFGRADPSSSPTSEHGMAKFLVRTQESQKTGCLAKITAAWNFLASLTLCNSVYILQFTYLGNLVGYLGGTEVENSNVLYSRFSRFLSFCVSVVVKKVRWRMPSTLWRYILVSWFSHI